MMAYRKPSLFTRKVFNPLATRLGMGGSRELAVPGRRSGKIQRVPVIPVEHGGARYLVSPRGESDWVKNLRAAGGAELGSKPFRAVEIPVAEREPILTLYQRVAGKAVASHFKALPGAADHPVFRIEPGETR